MISRAFYSGVQDEERPYSPLIMMFDHAGVSCTNGKEIQAVADTYNQLYAISTRASVANHVCLP